MEAEGGVEPPYTALQAVDLKLYLNLISRLHGKSGNPLYEDGRHFPTSLFSTQPRSWSMRCLRLPNNGFSSSPCAVNASVLSSKDDKYRAV